MGDALYFGWEMISSLQWKRRDGAMVVYDERANYMYAKPWLKKHKGWVAYLPGKDFPISYKVPNSFMKIPIKFASAENAIKRIENIKKLSVTPTKQGIEQDKTGDGS